VALEAPAPQRFFASLDELAPNKWTQQGPFQIPDIGSATLPQMMGHEDDPLYAPFLNSHLLDNYLNEPTATLGGISLSAETSALLSNDLIATGSCRLHEISAGNSTPGQNKNRLAFAQTTADVIALSHSRSKVEDSGGLSRWLHFGPRRASC
jgi:hypothetical protein